jgi:tetratricopeptide (TPR) repeat protein
MESPNGLRNADRANGLLETFSRRLEDGVTNEFLTTAVTLGCGHSYNESTIESLAKQDRSKYLCPECRVPIQSYQPSYDLRNLAACIARLPPPSEPKESSPQKEERPNEVLMDAQAHLQRGRDLFDQGFQEESVAAILKALEINPNFEKALDFLDFITTPKSNPKSSPRLSPLRQTSEDIAPSPPSKPMPSAPPREERPDEIQMEKAQDHFHIGKTFYELGLQEEATAAVKIALALDPNFEKAQEYLAFITDPMRSLKAHRPKGVCTEGPLNVESKTNETALAAYNALRPILLVCEVIKGKFKPEHLEDIKDFQTHSSTWCITYTNPTKKIREVIDLWAIEEGAEVQESALREALIHLRKSWPACTSQDPKAYVAHSQRNESGLQPLVKNMYDKSLQRLSHDFKHAIDNLLPIALAKIPYNESEQTALIRDTITRRFLFVEFFYTQWAAKLDAAIQTKTQELEFPGHGPQVGRKLQNEKQKLMEFQEKLKRLDIYALSKVLMVYPVGGVRSYAESVRMVTTLQNEVEREILGHVEAEWKQNASVFDRFKDISSLGQKRALSEGQINYAREVALCAILDRESYKSYCASEKLKMKREGITDLFVREAIKFAEMLPDEKGKYGPGTEYMAEGIQKSVFLKDFGDELKTEMQKQLRDLGIIATHAIPSRKGEEYKTTSPEKYPDKADAKQKRAVDERNAGNIKKDVEILRKHIADHRVRVKQDLTLEEAQKDWPRTLKEHSH